MQGILLVMCIIFRTRQHKHGLDDFGRPLDGSAVSALSPQSESDSAAPTTPVVESAVSDAVRTDVRSEHDADVAVAHAAD